MKPNIYYKILIPLIASLSLGACNIDPISDEKKEEIRKTAIEDVKKTFTGVIDNLDTLKVNGVEFDTENAKIYVNGKEVDYSQLELGMLVTVSGIDKQNGTGVALSVEYDQQLSGVVVDNNFGADGTLDVMGQTVYVNSDTVIDSDDDSAININDITADYTVEVSGYTAGDGKIWATRVEVKVSDDAEKMEVEGEIYNTTDGNFMIGELTIVYEPTDFDSSITSQLLDGVYVEVSSIDGYNDAGELVANEIDIKYIDKSFEYERDDEEVEVKGVVTNVISETEIEVNGTTILLTDLSSTPTTLSEGDRVEVKAEIDADGNLNVLKIEREDESEESDDSERNDDLDENDDSNENHDSNKNDNSDENDDSDEDNNSDDD